MEFKKFGSIENLQRKDHVLNMKTHAPEAFLPTTHWIITEKIHGSCITFYCDGKEVQVASRTRMLETEEQIKNFYGIDRLLNRIKDRLINLYKDVCITHPQTSYIALYGEYFGGKYPHKEVEPVKEATKVQKGVWYHPDNKFMAFALRIFNKDGSRLLDYETRKSFLDFSQIKHVPVLFGGTFEACANYQNKFQTTIPIEYNLPEIENNICEGVVLELHDPMFMPNGGRIILKNKNEHFQEVHREKKSVNTKINKETEEAAKKVFPYVTENRLRNVLSKIGKVTDKDFGKIMKAFNEDILEEYGKDNPDYKHLEKKEQKFINRMANKKAAELIRTNFFDILAGEF